MPDRRISLRPLRLTAPRHKIAPGRLAGRDAVGDGVWMGIPPRISHVVDVLGGSVRPLQTIVSDRSPRFSTEAARSAGVVVALLLLVSGCGGSDGGGAAAGRRPVAGEASPTTTLPRGTSIIAQATGPQLAVYETPAADTAVRTLTNPIKSGGPLVLLVDGPVEEGADRVRVLLPMRPNGSSGWVSTSDVRLLQNRYGIRIDLGERRLTVLENGEPKTVSTIAVGSEENPTPEGYFFITELIILPDSTGDYGPFAFGISAFSETLTEFNGGNGQAGIHGTNDPSSIGRNVSHGCIRLPNDTLSEIRAFLPLGTPVEITG